MQVILCDWHKHFSLGMVCQLYNQHYHQLFYIKRTSACHASVHRSYIHDAYSNGGQEGKATGDALND
jgi:hypothetical protein